jgi:hypothetical protein
MSDRCRFALLLVIAVLRISGWGQDVAQRDNSVPDQQTPMVSAPFASETTAFQPELVRTNYLDAGFGVSSMFDDNTLNTTSDTKSDFSYCVMADIALRQSRGRLNWKMNYAGGFTAHQRFSTYNQGSHDFDVDASYKLAPHVDLAVADHFRMTSGFFDRVNLNPDISAGTILQQPNQSVITPIAYQNSNTALVKINDQFSQSSAIGASATFFQSHYIDVPVGTLLIDTNSQEAEGYYNRRLSQRQSLGLTYRFQRLTFSSIANDTTVHSVLATYELRLQTYMTLTIFGGPQHVSTTIENLTSSVPVTRNPWSGVAGASFVWNGLRTGITLSAMRMTSDGGGLLGAVTLTGGSAVFRRQLSRQLNAELGFTYGLSDSLEITSIPSSSLKTVLGSAAIMRQVNNWKFTLGYARASQLQSNSGNGMQDISHNRAWTSISYEFSRPLGRN